MKQEKRIKEVTKKVNYTIYISDDGKEFNTEKDCKEYELKLNNIKIKSISELKKIQCEFGDFYTWYYINDKSDLESLKKFIENISWKVCFTHEDEESLLNTWVSYNIVDGGDYQDSCTFETIRNINYFINSFEDKLNRL